MRRAKKLLILLLAASMVIVFAGCGKSLEKRMEAAMERIQKADSFEGTLSLYGTIKISAQGQTMQLPLRINAEIKALTKAKKLQIVLSMNFMTLSQVLGEFYIEQLDNGTVRAVMHDVGNSRWSAQILDAKTAFGGTDPWVMTQNGGTGAFTAMRAVDKETIDGVAYDVVEFKINMDKFNQILGEQLAKQSPMPTGADGMVNMLKTAIADSPLRVWLSKSGDNFYKMKWDLSKLGNAIIDLVKAQLGDTVLKDPAVAEQINNLAIVDLYIEIVYEKVGGVEPFTIPDVPVKTT